MRYAERLTWISQQRRELLKVRILLSKQKKKQYAISRRRRNILFVCCLLFVFALISADHLYYSTTQYISTAEPTAASDLRKYHCKTFKVINIVDGDTIDIDVADYQSGHTRIRFWGLDTPETKNTKTGIMYFGPQASEFTTQKVLGQNVKVILDPDRPNRCKYKRLLAYIQLEDQTILNELLISQGFAYVDLRFDFAYKNKYRQLQALAISQKRGLWKEVNRQQLPQWLQKMQPNLLKTKD